MLEYNIQSRQRVVNNSELFWRILMEAGTQKIEEPRYNIKDVILGE